MSKLHLPHIQIASAAFHIYAAEGPKGMTMRKIAAAVGVRASALYRHFRNKDAILDAVADAADVALAQKLQAPAKQNPKKRRMKPLIGRALDFAVEQPKLFRLATSHRPRWSDAATGAKNILTSEVRQAMEKGELAQGDAKGHARSLWAQICGLVSIRERGDLPDNRGELRGAWFQTAQAVVAGLAPPLRAATSRSAAAA
ncbi:MAG TPA: TetR/AcrR family transcriptional regulator [Myxococcales bacterium]